MIANIANAKYLAGYPNIAVEKFNLIENFLRTKQLSFVYMSVWSASSIS